MEAKTSVLESIDGVEEMYQADLKAFEEINNSETVSASLEFCLSNTGDPTDYEAWSRGSERFAKDNYDVLKKWMG